MGRPPPDHLKARVVEPGGRRGCADRSGRALLADRRALDAIRVFADAYALALSAGERPAAALALLGQAQAEFAVRRLSDESKHAGTALDLLTVLAMPETKHAVDLIAQIDHYRFLP